MTFSKRTPFYFLIFFMACAFAFAGENKLEASKQVPAGKEVETKGVIVVKAADQFLLRDYTGAEVMVRMTPETEIEEKKNNFFRKAIQYAQDDLVLGLNVEIEGRGDMAGALVAEEIKFTQDDLKVAETIASRVTPVEARLGETEARLDQTRQHVERDRQRFEGEIEELDSAFKTVRRETQEAQRTADEAQQTAGEALSGVAAAEERITALDRYQEVDNWSISFGFDSARLSNESTAMLDEIVSRVQGQEGYIIQITGFASSDGNPEYNRRLSQRRADAVVRYLAEKHNVPLRRIVQPFGYGEINPVASNNTLEGRKQNRRVEVTLMVNEGLTKPSSVAMSPRHDMNQ